MIWKSTIRAFRSLVSYLRTIAFIAITFSYYVRLENTTLQPIRELTASRGNGDLTLERISKFVKGKEQEIKHVRIASTISAAATIGVFSWPEAADTHWAARSLWFTAMTLSFFSLITSDQSRLLEAIPKMDKATVTSENIETALCLITWMPRTDAKLPMSPQTVPIRFTLRNIGATYIWQCGVMQMSWAWVCLLVGLTLHVVRVFLPEEASYDQERVAIIFLVLISLSIGNFFGTGILLQYILRSAAEISNKRPNANDERGTSNACIMLSKAEKGGNVNISVAS